MTITNVLTAARAGALFNSDVPTGESPTPAHLTAAIQDSVRRLGGVRACAAEVAAAYGDSPETAVLRMRWALRVVAAAYPVGASPPKRRGTAQPSRPDLGTDRAGGSSGDAAAVHRSSADASRTPSHGPVDIGPVGSCRPTLVVLTSVLTPEDRNMGTR
jgi:hypothetical protein